MIRKAFKMRLYPNMAGEYEKRHNALWPEMKEAIHAHGGHNYSIFWTAKPSSYMDTSKLRMRLAGQNWQIPRSIVNGGRLWRISWRRIRTTAQFPSIWLPCSI